MVIVLISRAHLCTTHKPNSHQTPGSCVDQMGCYGRVWSAGPGVCQKRVNASFQRVESLGSPVRGLSGHLFLSGPKFCSNFKAQVRPKCTEEYFPTIAREMYAEEGWKEFCFEGICSIVFGSFHIAQFQFAVFESARIDDGSQATWPRSSGV